MCVHTCKCQTGWQKLNSAYIFTWNIIKFCGAMSIHSMDGGLQSRQLTVETTRHYKRSTYFHSIWRILLMKGSIKIIHYWRSLYSSILFSKLKQAPVELKETPAVSVSNYPWPRANPPAPSLRPPLPTDSLQSPHTFIHSFLAQLYIKTNKNINGPLLFPLLSEWGSKSNSLRLILICAAISET